jgi:hypothetical protein
MKIRVAFVIGQYPTEERKLREQAALSYATPEIEIGILSTPASPYIRGMSPTAIQMAVPLFIEAFREAERQGYDGVAPQKGPDARRAWSVIVSVKRDREDRTSTNTLHEHEFERGDRSATKQVGIFQQPADISLISASMKPSSSSSLIQCISQRARGFRPRAPYSSQAIS